MNNDLNNLYDAMVADDPSVVDGSGQWKTDLPTFGGSEPSDTTEVWSWDETRVIVGSCPADLRIITRDEHESR